MVLGTQQPEGELHNGAVQAPPLASPQHTRLVLRNEIALDCRWRPKGGPG